MSEFVTTEDITNVIMDKLRETAQPEIGVVVERVSETRLELTVSERPRIVFQGAIDLTGMTEGR